MKTDPFTEGTDLFSKGDLVYSKNWRQTNYTQQLQKKRDIIDNPSSVDLINALKVSGRTKDGQ
jgi:hypothetical protein